MSGLLPLIPAFISGFSGEMHSFHDPDVLGTRMTISVKASDRANGVFAAQAVRAEIDRLAQILNERDSGSELSRLNASPEMVVSAELFEVLSRAEAWRKHSGGAFCGRSGELHRKWARSDETIPDRRTLMKIALSVNRAHVKLEAASRLIRREKGVVFALDALAKGWIVDQALEVLLAQPGVSGGLIDVGGDIACGGEGPHGGWSIAIVDPMQPCDNARAVDFVSLQGGAIATSGRGVRDFHRAGKRFSTTLNPSTGLPVGMCCRQAYTRQTQLMLMRWLRQLWCFPLTRQVT